MKKLFSLVVMLVACVSASFADVVDEISYQVTGVSNTETYTAFSGKTATSNAVYAGCCAGSYNSIQLRVRDANEGVVTTATGGAVKKVKLRFDVSTSPTRVIDFYAKNTPYTSAADLFSTDEAVQGTLVASFAIDEMPVDDENFKTLEVEVPGNYQYIGFRSRTKAAYVNRVWITWDETYTPAPTGPAYDVTLCHTPRYTAGKVYENVLGPDLIDATKTKEGAAKPGIANKYGWIKYVNPTSTLDDGTDEVQTSNRWTNYDPSYDDYNYGEGGNWIQVTGANGSVNAPVLSSAWGKYMVAYVKDTKEVHILGIGSASGSAADGNNIVVVATADDGTVTNFESTPGAIYGKGTASDILKITLDPAKSYELVIKGNETVNKDIMVGAIRLYGASEVAGVAPRAYAEGAAYWEPILGPDMLATKTKTVDGVAQDKPGVSDEYPWIVYVNPTSTLDDGTAEVQTSNRWTDLNPTTGEQGTFIQVTGKNGSVNSPVLSSAWGKYMKFYVTGTKKFGVYATGSASGSAADGNRVLVHAIPFNSNNVIEGATEAGTIYGKGTASDKVFVELDETESYEIIVEGDPVVQKDIMLTAITLADAKAVADETAGVGTLNRAIAQATGTTIELNAGETYTVTGAAETGLEVLTINANGATIVPAEGAYMSVQKGLIINDAIIDASASGVSPIQLSATPDASLYTEVEVTPAVLYTAETAAAYNEEHAEEIADGELEAVAAGDVQTPAVKGMKYEGANQKVYEAEKIALNNSTVMTANSLVRPGAAWALRNLEIDNTVVEVKYKSGKAIINMEENGANSIQNITIKNSTIYADDPATDMRFIRYSNSSNAQSKKVWGTDDDNASLTLTNNTFVGVCGNKEFANNYVNNKLYQLNFTNNVFVNTWRINKIGTNNTRNFAKEDNLIMGGTQTVDGTDANWFTAAEDLRVVWNFAVPGSESAAKAEGDLVAAPAATDVDALGACFGLLSDYSSFGDPRWAAYEKVITEISELIVGKTTVNLKSDVEYTLNANAVTGLDVLTINGNGATIKVGAEGQFTTQKGIVIDNVVVDASAATKNFIDMSTTPDASLYTEVEVTPAVLYTAETAAAYNEEHAEEIADGELAAVAAGDVQTPAVMGMKYEGANQKVYEAEKIVIKNSTLQSLPQGLISGNTAKWALDELTIENSIVNFNTEAISGGNANQAAIALGSFKAINVNNSTIYNTAANNNTYFIRLANASNAQPAKVWGTGATATVSLEANTWVNAMGSKDFANNFVSNASQVSVSLVNNVFYDVFRVKNKLVGNNTIVDKENTPAVNIFDHSETYSIATDETAVATIVEVGATGIVLPTAETGFSLDDLGACFGLSKDYKEFGDPRWAPYSKLPNAVSTIETVNTNDGATYNVAGQRVNASAKGLVIRNGKKFFNK